ncbi:hypothetical protein Sipo8835_37840 [Streptomyces ipomoeae]|uniref:Uncharacterized protein n=3 Tax=Streptomyces ipomoeae TaxID=103232 RepID=L1KSP7_9ACTN|nr:hypothetical protein [Streptomyces ipomoeae]EKX63500.1 hypothetical protein STRIP9103_03253 [Streptomyces ipomoeae 91-03]MDX2846554.1 hypothetical protein [Streptomyces ipomoeae]TQE21164.1 hypothetical protein Sipo8835_37840 [Streptomyces ipomoeae]
MGQDAGDLVGLPLSGHLGEDARGVDAQDRYVAVQRPPAQVRRGGLVLAFVLYVLDLMGLAYARSLDGFWYVAMRFLCGIGGLVVLGFLSIARKTLYATGLVYWPVVLASFTGLALLLNEFFPILG